MLDGGPSRIPQPIDRRSARRTEVSRSQPDNAQSKSDNHQPSTDKPRQATVKPDKPTRKFVKPLLTLLVIVAICLLGWLAWTKLFGGVATTINSDRNQSVLLTNGQTYFGKLTVIDGDFFRLTDVFYVQSGDAETDAEEATSNNMQLIKRGEEVFGPEDPMLIARDQVLYFENIKDDSQVSQLMRDYKADN